MTSIYIGDRAVLADVATLVEHDGADGLIEQRAELTELGPHVFQATLTVRNASDGAITVTRLDSFTATLLGSTWVAHWFTSSWGHEFTPQRGALTDEFDLGTRSGRSSNGTHPWLGLEGHGAAVIVAPAWSGNWHITHTAGGLSAGISPWRFATTLRPGEQAVAPAVVIAVGTSIVDAATALTDAIGRSWIPRSAASDSMRVEWNHWWPYEDAEVSADVIEQNAAIAARIGIRQITLDAGWFGSPGDTFWEDVRGDWDLVNTDRFPDGLAAVGRGVRSLGAVPGIWIEAEAVGPRARLRRDRPEILARTDAPGPDVGDTWSFPARDPQDPGFLGYVCLGSPAGRDFVSDALERAVASIDAEWIKLDFNLDPGAGCTRTDHGHGAKDGLYRHYLGLYEVLDAFRDRHPGVILEACSSGGLRLDLGLARHVHCTFLSDPDYTEHHLQVLWGASHMLPPAAMLHWSWSQWRGDFDPAKLDFATIARDDFDTTLRSAMLQRFGVSLRLPELRSDLLDDLEAHVHCYQDEIAPLLRFGVLVPLTAQPLRDGGGERVPVFRVTDGDRHLIGVTVLPGGTAPVRVSTGLSRETAYRARDLLSGEELVCSDGTILLGLRDGETSRLMLLEPVTSGKDDA